MTLHADPTTYQAAVVPTYAPPYVPPFVMPPQPLAYGAPTPPTGTSMTTWIVVVAVAFAAGALAMHYGMPHLQTKNR